MSSASITDPDLEAQSQKHDAQRPAVTRSLMATPAEPRHRQLADPSPLGLLAFAQALFLISLFGVDPKGVTTPNVLISRYGPAIPNYHGCEAQWD